MRISRHLARAAPRSVKRTAGVLWACAFCLFACIAWLLLYPGHGAAQASQPAPPGHTDDLARGDDLHHRMRPLEALEVYQNVLAHDSTRVDALWRAAREAVNLGMLTRDDGARTEWYESAIAYGRRAVAIDTASVEGWVWLAIAQGRRALNVGPRARVRLANEIHASAQRALALDSTAAAAHHVLGEWHAEIRRLGGLTRFTARTLLGAEAFDQASWDDAEHHLRRAVELDPHGLIHHLALARVLLDRDQTDDARTHLEAVLTRPAREPTDALHKQAAQELLRDLS